MKYNIGQILYVVLRKEMMVYPILVVEEITKKKIDGEVTTYMVQTGANKDKQVSISEIDGEIFESADKAKQILIERATASTTKLIELAKEKSRQWYPSSFQEPKTASTFDVPVDIQTMPFNDQVAETDGDMSDESQYVVLPDGRRAKLSMKDIYSAIK